MIFKGTEREWEGSTGFLSPLGCWCVIMELMWERLSTTGHETIRSLWDTYTWNGIHGKVLLGWLSEGSEGKNTANSVENKWMDPPTSLILGQIEEKTKTRWVVIRIWWSKPRNFRRVDVYKAIRITCWIYYLGWGVGSFCTVSSQYFFFFFSRRHIK